MVKLDESLMDDHVPQNIPRIWKLAEGNSRTVKYSKNSIINSKHKGLTVSTEDYILYSLLDKKCIVTEATVFNTWVKTPFVENRAFVVEDDNLVCLVSKNYAKIIEMGIKDSYFNFYVENMEKEIKKIVAHRYVYFDHFNRLVYKGPMSLSEIFSLFMIWFSTELHSKVAGYIIDFVLALYFSLLKACSTKSMDNHFMDNYISELIFPEIDATENLLKGWISTDLIFYIDPRELAQYLVDYFGGINIFND